MQLCCQFTWSTDGQSAVYYKVSWRLKWVSSSFFRRTISVLSTKAFWGKRWGLTEERTWGWPPMAHASRLTWFRWDLARLLFILTYVNGKILKKNSSSFLPFLQFLEKGQREFDKAICTLHLFLEEFAIMNERIQSHLFVQNTVILIEREKKPAFTISHFAQFHRLKSLTLFNKSCVYQVLPPSPFNKLESSALNKEHK